MLREVQEIPDVARRIVAGVEAEIEPVARAIRDHPPRWATIAARGTSDHAAVYAQYLLETRLGIPTGLAKPSVTTVYGSSVAWDGGLVIGISQSGQSPDVVAVIAAARAAGATTVAITNETSSPLAVAATHTIGCGAGPELAVPATKTYVAELLVSAALVAAVTADGDLLAAIGAVPAALDSTLEESAAWLETAEGIGAVADLAMADRALVVSRGYNLATALELALKLKETVGLFAEAYSSADFAHGPRALIGPRVPGLAFRPDGPMGERLDATLVDLASDGVPPYLIGGSEVAGRPRALSLSAGLPEILTPAIYIVPGQLLVEATARHHGVSPDAPTGLAKVTRTR